VLSQNKQTNNIFLWQYCVQKYLVCVSPYLFIADFFATQIIGGAKELVVLL